VWVAGEGMKEAGLLWLGPVGEMAVQAELGLSVKGERGENFPFSFYFLILQIHFKSNFESV
jgi:hypothetical protein